MIELVILGHNGMLGNAVLKYFSQYPEKYTVHTLTERWGDTGFKQKLSSLKLDFIINCIGATPQKYSQQPEKYQELNIDLPVFLESLNVKIIHPSTDCEFLGDLPLDQKYTKTSPRDATDPYGKSKAFISEEIEKKFKNTKIMRVSIIGHELSEKKVSLLEWVLSSQGEIRGYTDHYWNGITTLAWAKICAEFMHNWDTQPILNQYGTEEIINKCDLAKLIARIYNHDLKVTPYVTGQNVNKCLTSDIVVPAIENQLIELKTFYKK